MADFDFEAGVKSDGSEAQLAAAISSSLTKAFAKIGPQLSRDLARDFKNAFSGAKLNDVFAGVTREANRFGDQIKTLTDRLGALSSAGAAQRKAFGEGFDPDVLNAFESSLEEIIRLQDEIRKKGGDPALEAEFRQRTNLIRSELTATRTAAQQSTLAIREAANSRQRLETQASRERATIARAENGRAVAELQTRASREVALVRSASQEQVALTQAAAKRRAAAFALVATAVRSSERAIRSTFEATSRVASAALTGIGRTASSVASGLGNAFRSANRSTVNNFNNANSNITNGYSRSWSKNSSIVNNELGRQETRVRQFAREATEEISTIGVGRLAGFAALGALAGRALTSGFQRAATLEDSERALTALLGSVEQAQELRSRVLDVVTGTPFALDQFANAATQLVAFNLEAEKIPRILSAIGDAASVRGGNASETIERLVRVFGQIQSSGRLTGEDLNQLAEAGVPALQILANSFGVLTGDMRDMISDGAVPAERALQVLTDGILDGSDGVNGATAAFGGLAKELGTTLRGSIGNFNAAFARLGATIITKFQPLLVNIVRSGTEAVDVLSSAFSSLGDAIAASPVFRVVGRVFENLGAQIEGAGERIKPVLDFLAEGLVAFGTAAGALAGLRRVPLLISAITFAIRRLLAPMNLLIGAGIVVSGFISRLVRENPTLAASLGALANSFGRIATIIGDLASDAFNALATVLDDFVTPAVGFLSDKIVAVAVPALERLNGFIVENVIPVVRDFAKFVRTEILPAVGNFLARALEIGTQAFRDFSEFIKDDVIPTVGPILARAVEIGRNAFEDVYDFLSGTLVPFIRSNLTPVLAGLGTALGVLALSGGNLPLAGLAGAGAGIAAVLTNDELRGRIVDFFKGVVETARDQFADLFDGGTIQRIGVGVLKVARTIGRVLGDALSDRRLITAVAGVAAAAAAVAGAFVLGFGEGVIKNIPQLAGLLGDAFVGALKAIASDAKVATAVAAALFGAAAIAKLVLAARQTGAVLAQALSQGAVTAGGQGAGGAKGLISGLLGGESAIRRSAAVAGQQYGNTLATAIRNEVRVIQKLGGNLPTEALGLGRVAGESFADQNKRLAATLQSVTQETGRLGSELGTAAVSGVRLREGLQQIASGNIRQGLSQLGTAIRNSGTEIATAAGALAGGAFAASFISQALFDVQSSGADKLQAGFGLAATGLTTAALTGSAALGGAVVGIGVLTAAIKSNEERAARAAAKVDTYATALRNAGDSALAAAGAITDTFFGSIEASSDTVQGALVDIGFNYQAFAQSVQGGDVNEQFALLAQRFQDAGVSGSDLVEVLAFLKGEAQSLGAGLDEASRLDSLENAGQTFDYVAQGLADYKEKLEIVAAATDVGATATQAYRDKVEELNNLRIDGLEEQVSRSKDALDAARGAADEALTALQNFLNGGDAAASGSVVDQAVVDVAGLARDLGELGVVAEGASAEVQSKFNLAFAAVKTNASEVLAQGIADGTVTDQATAEAALAPLISAAGATGTLAGDEALRAINEVLAGFTSEGGQSLLGDLFDANALIADAQTQLSAADARLKVGLEADPESFPAIAEGAREAFKTAGSEASAGFVEGIDSEAMATAAQEAADAALAAAESALGISSPSTAFAAIGRFSAAGYAQGLQGATALVVNASRLVGIQAMQGFRQGIIAGGVSVIAAARGIANQAAQVMRDALEVESPSKVTRKIGAFVGEGFALGIEGTRGSVLRQATRVATGVIDELGATGRAAAQAIGTGFAEDGPDFIGSVSSAMDKAYKTALSKAEQFKAIGKEIASNLFANQGTGPGGIGGGGGAQARLATAGLDILGLAGDFAANTAKLFEDNGFAAISFGLNDVLGRANQKEFLEAGLKIRDYGEALLESGVSAEEVAARLKPLRDQLVAVANARGASANINAGVLDNLLISLGLADGQLADFVTQVRNVENAARAAAEAETRRIAAEEAAEKAAEEAEKRAEEAAKAAEEAERRRVDEAREAEERARREYTLPGPTFRDLIVQSPSGDPEAVALATANRVAFSIRR